MKVNEYATTALQLVMELSKLDVENLLILRPSTSRDYATMVVRCVSKDTYADIYVTPDKIEVGVFSRVDGFLDTFDYKGNVQELAKVVYLELIRTPE